MKPKRWISLLVTLALCLGLLPGAALAEGEGTESSLPEGYEQMYVEDNGSYVTVAEGTVGRGGDIWLYSDANSTAKLNTTTTNSDNETVYENYNITCDEAIGEMGFGRNGTNWRKGNVKPGAEGYIYAEPVSGSGTKYAIKAKVVVNPELIYDDEGNSKFTVDAGKEQAFTFPPTIYVDGVSKRLTKDDFNSETYTFTCDLTIGTLSWHEGFNELAINTTNITSETTGSITITNNSTSAVYTCEVMIRAVSSGEDEGTGGNDGTGGEDEDTPELMYRYMSWDNGQPWEDTNRSLNAVSNLSVTYGGSEAVRFYYGTADENVPVTSVSVSEGSCIAVTEGTTTDGNSTTYWELEGTDLGTATLSFVTDGQTYSAEVQVILPDNGFYTSYTNLSKVTYLPDGFTYDGTNDTFYLVWNNSHSYISADSKVSITYWNSDLSDLISTALVEIGETFNDTAAKRYAIKFTVANTVSNDFGFEVNFELINRDGKTETNNRGINVTDNTPKLMYRYMSWNDGQPYEDVSRSLRPASELSISYGNTETVKFYYGTEGSYVAISEVTAPTNSCIKVTPGTTTDGKSTAYWELEGTDLGTTVLSVSGGTGTDAFTASHSWTVDLPLIGIYSGTTASKDAYCSNVEYTGNDIVLYILPNSSDVTITSVTANGGPAGDHTTISNNVVTISSALSGSCNLSYKVLYTIGNSSYDVYIDFAFTGRNQEDSGNGDGGSSGDTLLEAAHTLEENEKYSSSTINEHMGEFTLPGDSNTYYMVPSSLQSSSGTDYPHLNGDSSSYSAETRLMFIEFWVAQGQNNYARVKDTATLAKIQEAFGDTLKMELLAAEYYQSPLPTEFPATYATTEVESWREPIKAKFDTGSAGTWVYCASGTLNEGTDNETVVTAEVRSSIWFRSDVTWSPTVGSGSGDVITQVNNYLAGTEAHNVTSQSGIIIELPAGTYYGYIIVPRDLAANSVTIAGNGAEGENATILRGGVQGENRRTHVRDIHFIGGGSGNGDKEWKNFSDGCGVNNGKDNYAFYGDCGGNFRDCVFENYYCAVLTTGETKTGVDSLFKENQTAVCYNSTDWGGIGDPLANNVYQNNEVAIHFVQFTNQVGLSILSITGSCFVDNKTDIRNDIKRNIYVPGNYFAETKEGVETVRECQYLPKANGNKEKVVHYYPQSANRQFNVWIYDMSFYKHDPVVSANLAATYKIPAEYLTKSVTVMNEDETLAVWIFGKEGEE